MRRFLREPSADPVAVSTAEKERERLLRDALTARAQSEALQVRAELAREELEAALVAAEEARSLADAARARHEFLSHAGRRLASSMDYRTTLCEVAEAAVPVLGDWCAVTIVRDDGAYETLALAHADPAQRERAWELARRFPAHPDSPIGAAQAIRSGELQLVDFRDAAARADVGLGDPERAAAVQELGVLASLSVPLRTPTGVIGAITHVLTDPRRRFAREDVEVATSLAARAALHVQNARMYAERSHVAHTLQRSLLPPELPEIPGVELAVRYHAAGRHGEVGGDLYDVFPCGEEEWTIVVGDVCGKGAEAAALTSLTRHTLFAAALRGEDPTAQLDLVNEAMLARGDELRFATLAHVRLRPAGGGGADGEAGVGARVTNAGHPPPLVLRADGTIEQTTARGTVLGAFADPVFESQELELRDDDVLVLYTDGVTELRTSDPDFGHAQLCETLRGHAGCTAAGVVEAVARRAFELQDGRPRDDVAVLALRVRAF